MLKKIYYASIIAVIVFVFSGCHSLGKLNREFNPPSPKYGNCKCYYYGEKGTEIKTKCRKSSSNTQCDSVCGLDEHTYGANICRL